MTTWTEEDSAIYLAIAPVAVPRRDEMNSALVATAPFDADQPVKILELGSGDGRLRTSNRRRRAAHRGSDRPTASGGPCCGCRSLGRAREAASRRDRRARSVRAFRRRALEPFPIPGSDRSAVGADASPRLAAAC